jgi:hypothetical protein
MVHEFKETISVTTTISYCKFLSFADGAVRYGPRLEYDPNMKRRIWKIGNLPGKIPRDSYYNSDT